MRASRKGPVTVTAYSPRHFPGGFVALLTRSMSRSNMWWYCPTSTGVGDSWKRATLGYRW